MKVIAYHAPKLIIGVILSVLVTIFYFIFIPLSWIFGSEETNYFALQLVVEGCNTENSSISKLLYLNADEGDGIYVYKTFYHALSNDYVKFEKL